MIEELVELMKALEESDELFDCTARLMRKAHQSLVKAGFSNEEAVHIVAGQGMGVKNS